MGFLAAIPAIAGAVGSVASIAGGIGQSQNQATGANLNGQLENYSPSTSTGLQQQNQVFGQENNLANLLQNQVMGGGPNIAQTQLQAATGQNVQQAAGLIGSERGLNSGLGTRQILGQTAAINQSAANQSAQLQQQQQLAAQQQLASLYGQQGSQGLGLFGTSGQLNNQQIAQQVANASSAQKTQAGTAQFNAGQLGSTFGGLTSGVGTALQTGLTPPTPSQQPQQQQPAPLQVPQVPVLGQPSAPGPGLFSEGGPVDGRAPKAGDDPQNDIVSAKLSPGEFVIPRTIMAKGEPAILDFIRANRKSEPKQKLADGGNAGDSSVSQDLNIGQPASTVDIGVVPADASENTTYPTKAQQGQASYQQELSDKGFGQAPAEAQAAEIETQGKIGKVEARRERLNAKSLGEYEVNLSDLSKRADSRRQTVQQFGDQIQQGILNNTIDPNRLWANASTENKINSIVGIMLGGVGQGMMHTNANQALNLAQDLIRNDIDSQKANVNRLESVFSNNLKQGDSEEAAYAHAMDTYGAVVQAKLAKAAASTGDQMAILKSQALQQQLAQKRGIGMDQARILTARRDLETKIFPAETNQILDPDQKKRVVNIGSGRLALASTPEDAKDAAKALTSYQPILDNIDALDKLDPSALLKTGPEYGRAQELMANTTSQLLDLRKNGRISEPAAKFLSQQLHDPSSWLQATEGGARNKLFRKQLYDQMSNTLSHTVPAFKSANDVKGARPANGG